MGGADKGLVELRGVSLVAHAIERLSPQEASVMISANRIVARYRSCAPRVLRDAGALDADFPVPRAGIEAELTHAQTAWVVEVPCDVPDVPEALDARLPNAVNDRGIAAACARVDGRLQPVFRMLSHRLLGSLRVVLAMGAQAVHAWLGAVGAAAVNVVDARAFRNFNTSETLADGRR